MSDRSQSVDEAALTCGLLMESAQALQKTAELSLDRLRAHAQGLDGVVRETIGRTMVEELRLLTAESERACRALRDLRRAATLRTLLWSLGITGAATGVPLAIARVALPSAASVAALRTQRDALASDVAFLEQRGGLIQWKRCGGESRLCVRIDKSAAPFGAAADYAIVKGY